MYDKDVCNDDENKALKEEIERRNREYAELRRDNQISMLIKDGKMFGKMIDDIDKRLAILEEWSAFTDEDLHKLVKCGGFALICFGIFFLVMAVMTVVSAVA